MTFAHGLVVGLLAVAVILIALTALVMAMTERDRTPDDPYRALFAAATRPRLSDDA